MANRPQLWYVVTDQRTGKVIENAKVLVYETGTTTAPADLHAAPTGGVPIAGAFLTSNAQGEVKGYPTTPRNFALEVTDNGDACFYPASPGVTLSFPPFTEDPVPAYEDPVEEQTEDDVHPEEYGAVADGITNDAAAIILAIAEAVSSGRTLSFRAKSYYTGATTLTTPSTSGGTLRIRGAGKGRTKITRLAGSATNTLTVSLTGAAVFELSDLTIAGPTGLAADNLSFAVYWPESAGQLTKRALVRNVEITGTHDQGLDLRVGDYRVIDCDITVTDVPVACFESSNTANPGFFYARGGTWQNDLAVANDGVGFYVHPHYPYLLEGVTIQNVMRFAIYQNGSPSQPRRLAAAVGCRFINTALAQTKATGPTLFSGCSVYGNTAALFGSQLAGDVTIANCLFNRHQLLDGTSVLTSRKMVEGCRFYDSAFVASFGTTTVRGCDFFLPEGGLVMGTFDSVCECSANTDSDMTVEDCLFDSDATTGTCNFIVKIDGPRGTVRKNRFRNLRQTNGLVFAAQNTPNVLLVDDNDFDLGTGSGTTAIDSDVGGSVEGSNNRFSGMSIVNSGQQSRMTRRVGVNPSTVASAATIDTNVAAWLNYDTHVVDGAATINTLSNPTVAVGVVRLVVAAGASWSTSAAGNITPLTAGARTPGTVVTLLWEPTAAKWLEV